MFWPILVPFVFLAWLLAGALALSLAMLGGLLWLPFLLIRLLFKIALGVMLLPFLLVAGLLVGAAALVAFFFTILVPLVPLALLGLLVWVLVRASSRSAASPA